MKRTRATSVYLFLLLLFGFTATGCDAFDDLFGNDKEISGIVEEVGSDYLVVDAIRYQVTSKTEYEGYNSLADVQVNDEVDIEYEENGDGTRTALEIEKSGAEDDD